MAPPSAMADLSAPVSEAAMDDVDDDLCLLIDEPPLLLPVADGSISPGLPGDDCGSCHVDDALVKRRECRSASCVRVQLPDRVLISRCYSELNTAG